MNTDTYSDCDDDNADTAVLLGKVSDDDEVEDNN